ncbi:hypothetical protein FZ103_04775 [Streptomonospora sp. PA3]|uniref:hypothetical protein n=1 Tax=Streptomonospora sp. PA3 TaxID=2607326 RepID=UPI0012DBFE9F|nr:hypothetical protein [Streptomonospora sp. PA3]MUL40498.1 hypothetical protein [Streptomonospora sp. PA3]
MTTERFRHGTPNGGEAEAGAERPPAGGGPRGRGRWAPAAAVLWSTAYACAALYWALSGRGFPFADVQHLSIAPLAARFGEGPAWAAVVAAGLPAAAAGAAMLSGTRAGRPLLVAAGTAVSALLLFGMTDVLLLQAVGYVPYSVVGLLTGSEVGAAFLETVFSWGMLHRVACLAGGFLWAVATVAYARSSADRCLRCGRGEASRTWTAPRSAARWGRAAVLVAVVPPLLYATTRFAWALGVPLGISREFLREGQQSGMWVAGAFLAGFAVVGAVLTLGLIQRWGEVFPRWMPGLAGRRVPVALAVVPASLAAVLLIVGGFAMLSGYAEMVASNTTGGEQDAIGGLVALSGGLFPVWGAALAAAALAYHLRRRGACPECGRGGAPEEAARAR